MSEPGVGDKAPGFTLPGTGGRDYDLESYRGRNVVLVFYPGDNTPVCTAQLTSYTRDISQFSELGAQVLAISPQSVESHESSAPATGASASRCWPTPTSPSAGSTACSARSASTAVPCS